jgi:hypothetical protein
VLPGSYLLSAVLLALFIAAGLLPYLRKQHKRAKGTKGIKTRTMTFEFGETEKSKAFLAHNPEFPAALDRS